VSLSAGKLRSSVELAPDGALNSLVTARSNDLVVQTSNNLLLSRDEAKIRAVDTDLRSNLVLVLLEEGLCLSESFIGSIGETTAHHFGKNTLEKERRNERKDERE